MKKFFLPVVFALAVLSAQAQKTVSSGSCGAVSPNVTCIAYFLPVDSPVGILGYGEVYNLNMSENSNQGSVVFSNTKGPNGWLGSAAIVSSTLTQSSVQNQPTSVTLAIEGNYAQASGGGSFNGTLVLNFSYSTVIINRWRKETVVSIQSGTLTIF